MTTRQMLPHREGLGQLPMHGVCAFTTTRSNQYMSNSAWNTISLCFTKQRQKRKYTEGRLKTSSVFLLKAVHRFSDIWQVVVCCSSQRRQTERIYKYCLNVSTQLISLYCVCSWRYSAITKKLNTTLLVWPAWTAYPHIVKWSNEGSSYSLGWW